MWYAVVSVAWGEWTHTRKMILEVIVGGGDQAHLKAHCRKASQGGAEPGVGIQREGRPA